ncbi:hypothetical protein LshimejAT787_1701220 [Lyophyllum shimeji]|uniref:Carbohydrate esterase family 16 protein n=1 Tax=Lyophyllum shimeji TaxID=47721 RepID=A0A9P3PYS8_LYOSH|nr:hypothetical protein LshimejAT787_1701220 [Lyophyllum shimeji]
MALTFLVCNHISLLFSAALAAAPAVASILDSTRFIFTFGDSYTTEGWNGSGDPLSAGVTWCSSAGPNWARQFTTLTKNTQLVNLAVSGATSDKDIVFASPPDFRSQVTSFTTYVAPFPDKVAWTGNNSIFTVSFGTNDVNNSYKNTDGNGTSLYSRDLDSYFATVDRLYAAGARRFLFNNVVPFDRAQTGISQGPTLQAKLKDSILEFNSQLASKAQTYCASKAGITCAVFDTHALFTIVMDNFRRFGFATPDGVCNSYAARGSCTVDPTVDSTCLGPISAYVWKDGLHPATGADTLWAKGVIAQLSTIN